MSVENEETLKIIPLYHHKEVLVQMRDCSLSYKKKTVREHFDMELKRGERIVLSGKNGCGNLRDFAVKNGIDETLFFAVLRKRDFKRI